MSFSAEVPSPELEVSSDPAAIEDRIDDLLAQMTLDEKINLCHAGSKFAVAAVPASREFQSFRCPMGHTASEAKFVATVGIRSKRKRIAQRICQQAPPWQRHGIPNLAYRFGEVLGAEARHRGKDVILGPGNQHHPHSYLRSEF